MGQESAQFCMLVKPDRDDPFDCLRQRCQIGNWSIGIHVFRIEIRFFSVVDKQSWLSACLGNCPLQVTCCTFSWSGTNRLMSHVGAGSNMQCFAGDAPTISKISSAVTGRTLDRAGNCLGSITGGLALDVDERILLTLFWKKTANSSGENLQSDVAMGWLMSTPIFDQSAACRIFQAHDLGMKKTRKTWSAFT